MVEISSDAAGATLTAATALILETQRRGEPAAWIIGGSSSFYPPDVAASGVDLEALIVVRADTMVKAARAADHLLRSGGFALVIIDLVDDDRLRMGMQSRLLGLANAHQSAVVCLTRKQRGAPSIGSLVSIRGDTTVEKTSFDEFAWDVHVVKDKRRGPGWHHTGLCRGPEGLH
jgi:recombination protein RecA